MNKKTLIALILTAASVGSLTAAPIAFDFKDPKGVNNIVFRTDAPLESINGTGTGISGTAQFDPENPGSVTGKITLAVASIGVPNDAMQGHLVSARWLDAEKYPNVTFEVISTTNVRTNGDTTEADVKGSLTVKDVTREITVPVKITFLKGKLKARGGSKVDGDLLVLRSNFSINRDDYNISAGQMNDKVANEIQLSMSVVGIAPYAE